MIRVNTIPVYSFEEIQKQTDSCLDDVQARCKLLEEQGYLFMLNKSQTMDTTRKWAPCDPKKIRQSKVKGITKHVLWAVRAK